MKLSLIMFGTKGKTLYRLISNSECASDLAKACVKLAEIYTADWMQALLQSSTQNSHTK